jgi:hypothetical protein
VRRGPALAFVAGLVAGILLLAGGFFDPRAAYAGWLIGFLFWSGIAVGGLVLAMIHSLTGGRWGTTIAATLVPAAASVPLFCLLFVPVGVGLGHIFPWARTADLVTSPSVARLYLNAPSFLGRAAVALLGWSLLSILLIWAQPRRTALLSGLGLVFHGVAVTFVSLDWVLSVDPNFYSTDFGADFAFTQMLAALAWAALFQRPQAPGRYETDLGQLLLATTIGVFYLTYIGFVVHWYGDLPDKAAWWLKRREHGWDLVVDAAFILSAAVPFAALLLRRVRRSGVWMRWIGASILAGIFLRFVWLVAPEFGPWALLGSVLGTVAVGGLWAGIAYGLVEAMSVRRRGEAARGLHA